MGETALWSPGAGTLTSLPAEEGKFCWEGPLCHRTGTPASLRTWTRGNGGGAHQGNSCRTDRLCVLLKKDFLSWVRVAHAHVQAAEDLGRPLDTLLCPVFAVGRTWLLLAVFSHFKRSCSVLLWSFVCFVWFCFFLFSPLEEKHHLPHSGAVFWTSCTDQKPFEFWCWCLLAVRWINSPLPTQQLPSVCWAKYGLLVP